MKLRMLMQMGNYYWKGLLKFVVLLSMMLLFSVQVATTTNNCTIQHSLTIQQQMTTLSNFTTSTYLPLSQHAELTQAYSTLSTLDSTYLVQLNNQFNFTINDIPNCNNIPEDVTFTEMDDVWVCFTGSFMVLKCNMEWELKIGCGTMVEIHRPFNVKVLGSAMLEQNSISQPFSISAIGLCAGTYHLWFVYSTRIGKVIKSVKPIFITYPPCICQ